MAAVFDTVKSLTPFDYAVLAIFVISLLFSAWRGVVSELISLAAWVLAFIAARTWGTELGRQLYGSLIQDAFFQLVAGWITIFLFVLIVMSMVRLLVRRFLRLVGFGFTDRILGMAFGCVRGALILVVLTLIAGLTSIPREPWWRDSVLARPLEMGVLAVLPYLPSELAGKISFR